MKPTLPTRWSKPENGDTRGAILDAALAVVNREGLEGLTIGELAKSVGMSKSGLFAHFGNKDQLQLAVMELATTNFVDLVLKPSFKKPPGVARLQALFDNWLKHLVNEKARHGSSVLIAASLELDDRPGPLRDYVRKVQQDLIANLEKAARIAVQEKEFRADLDVELFAWSMYSFVLGYYHFKRMLEDKKAEVHVTESFNALMKVARGSRTKTVRSSPKMPLRSNRKLGQKSKAKPK